VISELINDKEHIFVDQVFLAFFELTIIVKLKETFLSKLRDHRIEIDESTLPNDLFCILQEQVPYQTHLLLLNLIIHFLIPSGEQRYRALGSFWIVSLHMHQDDEGFGPIPALTINDLFFNFVDYEFNKCNVLLVIDKSSFKYLNRLCS
jgi:hypothetical protein